MAETEEVTKPTEKEVEALYAQPVLKRGDSGEVVRGLRQVLGVDDDGVFGDETEEALKSFQTAFSLRVDGMAGPQVWLKLLKG